MTSIIQRVVPNQKVLLKLTEKVVLRQRLVLNLKLPLSLTSNFMLLLTITS